MRADEPAFQMSPQTAKALMDALMDTRGGDGWSEYVNKPFLAALNVAWPVRYDFHHPENRMAWASMLMGWGAALLQSVIDEEAAKSNFAKPTDAIGPGSE